MKRLLRTVAAVLCPVLLIASVTGCANSFSTTKDPVSDEAGSFATETTLPTETTTATMATTSTASSLPSATATESRQRTTPPPTTQSTTQSTTHTTQPTTAPSAQPALVGEGRVNAPYVSQAGFPTGCESASAVMLLRFWGVNMDMDTFVDDYLDKGTIRWENGRMLAPHPAEAFVGSPRSESAYGCYAPVIVRALERCVPADRRVVNETGASLPELCARYIDNGYPVIIWASIAMIATYGSDRWTTPSGESFTWPANEHCLLLVGYDKNDYYLNDPYKSRGCLKYARSRVEQRYRELGCQAVGILPT